jgi:DNA repair exonuclease SbcCD ATPase subunit
VSNKKHPLLKHWLTNCSVAFIVSCGCSLPFTQNLAESALIGLATIPGVAASRIFSLRQRHQQVNRQLERGKLRLNELQHRGEVLNKQLQVRGKDCQEIEIQVAQLHSLAANLSDRIQIDRIEHQHLEQQRAALTLYCQEQQGFAIKLDRKIQDKQARLLELETNFTNLKLESAQLQAARAQIVIASDRAKIALKNIQSEIERCSHVKQELERQIGVVQSQQQLEGENVASDDRQRYQQRQLALAEQDLVITERQNTHQSITTEIERLDRAIAQKTAELSEREDRLEGNLEIISAQELRVREVESEFQAKQVQLDELLVEILHQASELESRDRDLKMTQLELSSKQAELDNLEFRIHTKLRSIDEIDLDLAKDLQALAPQPPTILRNVVVGLEGEWHEKFIDNPHLPVLQHIEKHGTITEAEASSKLGNARSVRQFANKLEEYTPDLPFSIRVESSPKGNRYLKETQN